jgi:hypothetical protein
LVQLEPAQVALGLVVVERDRQVIQEGKHLLLVQIQPLEQIARRGLLNAPAVASLTCRWRVGGKTGCQQRLVAGEQGLPLGGWQTIAALSARVSGSGMHRPQQVFEFLGPGLLELFFQEGQFAQMAEPLT